MLWMPADLDNKVALLGWAEERLPDRPHFDRLKAVAAGIFRGNELVAVVVYDQLRGGCIEMSIAATSPRWATRETVTALLSWPFVLLSVRRITCLIATRNTRSRKLCEGLGFAHEGRCKAMFPDDDGDIFGLTRSAWERSRWCVEPERKAA